MDAFLCTQCKRVEQKPWKDDCYWSKYNSCHYCRCTGDLVVWLRTDEQKKEALISEFEQFFDSAKRAMELVSIAFPERRAMQQHEDGTESEVEVSLDIFALEGLFESLRADLKSLTRKVGE